MSETKMSVNEFNGFQNIILVNDRNANGVLDKGDLALAKEGIPWLRMINAGEQIPYDDPRYKVLREEFQRAQSLRSAEGRIQEEM